MNPQDRLVSENTTTEEALTGAVAHQAPDRVKEPAPDPAGDLRGRAASLYPVGEAARETSPAAGARSHAAGGPNPPRGATAADSAPLGGTSEQRTWTLELPAGMKLLSQNSRLHHMERHRRFQALKKAAWALALQAKIPPLERAAIAIEYQPRDNRDTDPDNVPPASGKPCIDALVAARILPDDSKRYVTSVKGVIGPVFPRGRIVLHITEATGEPAWA